MCSRPRASRGSHPDRAPSARKSANPDVSDAHVALRHRAQRHDALTDRLELLRWVARLTSVSGYSPLAAGRSQRQRFPDFAEQGLDRYTSLAPQSGRH